MCMKIVQEYLKTLDPDKLYDTYCSKYGAFKDVSAMSVPPDVMQKIREYCWKKEFLLYGRTTRYTYPLLEFF